MFSAGKNIRQIVISGDPESGLAEMFSGYLQHFSGFDIEITLIPVDRKTPAHVQAVLKEDGIHAFSGTSATKKEKFDVGVEINDWSSPESRSASTHRYYRITMPDTDNKEALRACREEMKRLAISFLGEIRHFNMPK